MKTLIAVDCLGVFNAIVIRFLFLIHSYTHFVQIHMFQDISELVALTLRYIT